MQTSQGASFPTKLSRYDFGLAAALGLLLLAIYLATSGLRFHSIDEIASFSVARSLAARGSFDGNIIAWTLVPLGRGSIVAAGQDGATYYVVKDVAPSILAVPLIWLAHGLNFSPVRAALLLSPLVSGLTGALLYLMARGWGFRPQMAAAGVLIWGLCSMAWPYAETLFTQPLAALGLLMALWGTCEAERDARWALIGGAGLGLAGLSAVPTWITAPAYLLYLIPWKNVQPSGALRRVLLPVLLFGLGAGMFAAGQAAYNFARFGDALQTGYQQVGALNISPAYLGYGLFGLLLSAPKGLIWYAPFTLLVPLGLRAAWHSPQRRPLMLAAAQAGLVTGLYSAYLTWWAGLCWGPRFLVAVMPALVLLCLPVLQNLIDTPGRGWARAGAAAVLALSLLTQAGASLFDYLESEAVLSGQLDALTPPPGWLPTTPALFNPAWLPLIRQGQAAFSGQWDVLALHQGLDWSVLAAGWLIVVAGVWLLAGAVMGDQRAWPAGAALYAALCVGFSGLMLMRYPQGPNPEPGIKPLVAEVERLATPPDAVITVLPTSYLAWLDAYPSTAVDYGFTLEEHLQPSAAALLEGIAGEYERAWLISEQAAPGDVRNGVERWLAERAFSGQAAVIEGRRIVPYTFAQIDLMPVDAAFADGIALAAAGYAQRQTGIDVRLEWQASGTPSRDYTVFVHLIGPDGALAAQHDGPPQAGYAPTSAWQAGQRITDGRHIALSPDLPPGVYELYAGLYDPASGQRLLLQNSADSLRLGQVALHSN